MDTATLLHPGTPATAAAPTAPEALEAFLGNPYLPETPFSFRKSVALDEAEQYPAPLLALLNDWGLNDYYIPQALGGKLRSIAESFALLRCVARRDLTAAIAHGGVFLGTVPVWLAGSPGLQRHVAQRVQARYKIALGLTEKDHGSDLLEGEVTATADGDGYTIDGEKWLVNHAFSGDAITVLTRTSPAGGPRGFSLFYVEKQNAPGAFSYAGKIKTMGVRGLDMNAIRFHQVRVPGTALLHALGGGLEVVIKSLQITRAMCAAFSLGAIDTAFRTVVQFAGSRRLYNGRIIDLPVLRRKLAGVFADILICECLSTATNRALHVIPGQFSVLSAVAKSFIPATIDQALADLATLLGARYYLREEYLGGIFQKHLRDHATVSLFDGNTAVNQQAIGQQLRLMAGLRHKESDRQAPKARVVLERVFDLEQELPPLALDQLEVFNKGKDDLMYGLMQGYATLKALAYESENESSWQPEEQDTLVSLLSLVYLLLQELQALDQAVGAGEASAGNSYLIPADLYQQAERYSLLHAASACLNTWLYNKDKPSADDFLARGPWLLLCLRRILRQLGCPAAPGPLSQEETLLNRALQLVEQNQSISLFPISYVPDPNRGEGPAGLSPDDIL
jgi:alkylation response protein AidB-like acyl-CoA dehydrogenase